MARVKVIGASYKGPKPTAGIGGMSSRARKVGGAFSVKRAANPFSKARRFESLAAGYKKVRPL